jgi:hypothetical protein
MIAVMSHAVAFVADDPFGSSLVLLRPAAVAQDAPVHVTSDAVSALLPPEPFFDYTIVEAAFSIGQIDLEVPESLKPEREISSQSGYSTRRAIAALFEPD